jgi:hypothetical protein
MPALPPNAHSPSTKRRLPTITYSEAWTAAPWTDKLHRLVSAAWPALVPPRGLRHSQPPAATPSPTLKFRAALHRRLGLPTLPRGAPTVTCFCGKALAATDSEHAHTCPTPNALCVLRHDELIKVVRRAMRQGEVTSSKEPLLAALQPGPRIRLPRAEARGNNLYVLTNELQVGDLSIVHPGAAQYCRAATAQRGIEMRAQYRQDEWGAYCFTPLSVETFGSLGAPLMRLLSDIRNLAVSRGDGHFTKEQFVSGVHRELSVSLCKTNAGLQHGFFVRASGVCIGHGRSRPTAEVSDWDQCVVLCSLVDVSDVVLSAFCSLCFLYLLVIMRLLVIPFLILWLWLHCSSCWCAPCALCCNHTLNRYKPLQ